MIYDLCSVTLTLNSTRELRVLTLLGVRDTGSYTQRNQFQRSGLMNMTEEDILTEIEKQKELSEQLSNGRNRDKLFCSDPYKREVSRLKSLLKLMSLGVKIEEGPSGCVLVEDKYVYALMTGRWRVTDKSTWYYSKSPNQFVETYVRKSNETNT